MKMQKILVCATISTLCGIASAQNAQTNFSLNKENFVGQVKNGRGTFPNVSYTFKDYQKGSGYLFATMGDQTDGGTWRMDKGMLCMQFREWTVEEKCFGARYEFGKLVIGDFFREN
jgi:hypothetical protein